VRSLLTAIHQPASAKPAPVRPGERQLRVEPGQWPAPRL